MAGLTWLHLSDWHQKGEDFDRKVVRDALIEDIKNRSKISKDLGKVDFIVFSGDLAFSGKKEEYQAAETHLIEPVLDATGLDKGQFFIVPGNHDLDLESFELLPEGLKKPLTNDDDIKKWLADNKKRSKILEPFEAYKEFVKEYANGNLSAYASSSQLNVRDKNVALFGFNSALMCGRHKDEEDNIDDKGKIILGEPQVYDTLKKYSDVDLRIVVMHHPFEWLTENDCITVENRLKKTAHFILCGHQHMPKIKIEKGTEGDCIIIPAGVSYERRKADNQLYNNAYNFVHLDFENNKGLGGLGKAQLAVEYAHCFRSDYPKGVIWLNADQEIEPQLIQIAKQAKWVHPESKHSDILDIAKQRLKTRSECLIIFENVEEREAIEPYLPNVEAEPHLLLTSRAPQKGFIPISISPLDKELSLKLLLKESGRGHES